MIGGPRLSVVVVGYDMARELPRTVRSLLPPYQRGVQPREVEIVVVDSGSPTPVEASWFPVEARVRILRVDDGGVSPCRAVNRGVRAARGRHVAVMIDGARMASPGLLAMTLQALRLDPGATIATLGFHLGPKVQQVSTTEGYDQDVEDRLLDGVGWPADGYRLFEISALGESYARGVLAPPPETTFFAMRRDRFLAMGGFDEGFRESGGGFANYDFFERAVADPDHPLVMLVGEATFHQYHGGATTRSGGLDRVSEATGRAVGDAFADEYQRLRGRAWTRPAPAHTLYGRITHPAVPRLFFPTDPR